MRTTGDFEREVVKSIVTEAALGDPVYMLLGQVLSLLDVSSVGSPDGVFFIYSAVSEREATAVGTVVMIDQTMEPLRVRFTLSESRESLSSSWVYLGDRAHRPPSYGTREHAKLEKAIIADPDAEYPWKLILHRTEEAWVVAADAG